MQRDRTRPPPHHIELALAFTYPGCLVVGGWALRSADAPDVELVSSSLGWEAVASARFSWYERPDVSREYPTEAAQTGFFAVAEIDPDLLDGQICLAFRSDSGQRLLGQPLEAVRAGAEHSQTLCAVLAEHKALVQTGLFSRTPRPLDLLRAAAHRLTAASGAAALSVDHALVLPDGSVFVAGWCHADEGFVRLEIVDATGQPLANVLDSAVFFPRPDVDAHLASRPRPNADAGFALRVAPPPPDVRAHGPLTFLGETPGGDLFLFDLKLGATTRDMAGTEALVDAVPPDIAQEVELFDRHLRGSLHALRQARIAAHISERPNALRVHTFGTPPADPDLALVVTLESPGDWLRYQLQQLGADRELEGVELLFVVADPGAEAALVRTAGDIQAHFGLPFQLLVDVSSAPREVVINAAVRASRAEQLLLLDGRVVSRGPGWLGKLRSVCRTVPNAGAVGPALISEFGTIVQGPTSLAGTEVVCPVRGLPEAIVQRSETACVPALSTACLLTERALYLSVGGLAADFWLTDFAERDLCRRLEQAGRSLYFVPEVTLDFLGALPARARTGAQARLDRYDRWLLQGRTTASSLD